MDSKHDNHKKLRPLEDGQIPPELQWENMEAGIFQKMEEIKAESANDSGERRRRRGFLFFFLLLGVLTPTALLLNRTSTIEDSTGAIVSAELPSEKADDAQPVVAENSTNMKEVQPQNYEQQTGGNTAEELQVERVNESDADADQRVELEASTSDIQLAATSSQETRRQIAEGNEARSIESGYLGAQGRLVEQLIAEEAVTSSPSPYSMAPVDKLTDEALIIPLISHSATVGVDLPTIVSSELPSSPSVSRIPAQFWATAGASWWSPGYGDTKPERAEFEESILSYQGQLNLVQPLKNDFFISAGIQYQRLENRFNWNTLDEDTEIVLEDTIIQIQRNAITGQETLVRGDVTLTIATEREVQHFNSFSLLQLPFAVGKSWGEKKWRTHLMLGGVASLSFSRTGRTLYAGKVADFDNDRPSIWSDKIGFNAMLGAGFSYNFTDRFGLVTMLQYQRSLSNWSLEEGVTMRPHILNWSFGAKYSL